MWLIFCLSNLQFGKEIRAGKRKKLFAFCKLVGRIAKELAASSPLQFYSCDLNSRNNFHLLNESHGLNKQTPFL